MFCERICLPFFFSPTSSAGTTHPHLKHFHLNCNQKTTKKTTYNIFAPVDTEQWKKKIHVLVGNKGITRIMLSREKKLMQHVLSKPQGRFRKPSAVSIPARACLTRSTCLNSFIFNFDSHSHFFIYEISCVIKLTCDCCGWNRIFCSSVGVRCFFVS